MNLEPVSPATGADVACLVYDGGPKSALPDDDGKRPALEFLKTAQSAETKAPITVALIGEKHRYAMDKWRASYLWTAFNAQKKGQRLVVLERGMTETTMYLGDVNNSKQPIVVEDEMLAGERHQKFASEMGRSVIVAAYLFLCIAGGRQDLRARVLVLFGENHINDIRKAVEYFALNSSIDWVRKRSRGYYTLTSLSG